MTRRFLDDIKTDYNALLVSNTTGDIDPLSDKALRFDTIDSTIDDEAFIYSSAPVVGPLATAVAFTSLTTGVYDTQEGDDSAGAAFLNTDFTNGNITGKNIAGFTYQIKGAFNFTPNNGVTYDFAIGVDGVPAFLIDSVTGQPGGDPAGAYVESYIKTAALSSVFTLMVRSPGGIDSLNDFRAALVAIIKPTNNP